MIAVDLTTMDAIVYQFEKVNLQNEEQFKQDLSECATSRFVKILKAVFGEEKFPADKGESIKMITEKVKENLKKKAPVAKVKGNGKGTEEKKAPQKKVEDPKVFQIKVNPDYKALVPRPIERDKENLKKSIQEVGLREKIKVLPDGTIVDGHSRYDALQELGIPINQDTMIEVVDMAEDQVMRYIYDENIPRRHLSDFDKIKWAKQFLHQIEEIKAQVKSEKSQKLSDIKSGKAEKTDKPPERVTDKVGQLAGVSGAQVRRQEFVERWAPEVMAKAVEEGKSLNEAYETTKNMKAAIERSGLPEVIDQVKNKLITLTAAYEQVKDLPAAQEPEKKPGPKGTTLLQFREVFEKIVKKHNNGELKLEGALQEIYQRLEAMIDNYTEKGQ